MLPMFWKMSLLIIGVNAFMFFIMGSMFPGVFPAEFTWLPSGMQNTNSTITNSNQVSPLGFPEEDINSTIEPSATSSLRSVPKYFSFFGAADFIYKIGFNILFGYFIWMQAIMPMAIVLFIGVFLAFIQLLGLFYVLQSILSVIGTALGLFR